MKKLIISAGLFLVAGTVSIPAFPGRGIFDILRVRTIPNPVPDRIEGEEVLEVTFVLRADGWVPGVGWSLRYYNEAKELLSTQATAYFPVFQNNPYLIKEDHFKGGSVFVSLFPLRPDAFFLVFALGDGTDRKVLLYPYAALLQDFNIPVRELDDEIVGSDYVVIYPPGEE